MRKVLGDFSSILAILLGCGLDAFLGLATPKLLVPHEFKVRVGVWDIVQVAVSGTLEKEEAGILIVSTQRSFPTWDSNNGHESCEGQGVVLSL